MMERRHFLLTSLAGALAAPPWVDGQPSGKSRRLGAMALAPTPPLLDAWREGLKEHGWVEGRNIDVDYRYSKGNDELFRSFAADFVRLKVDLIAAVTDPAVLAAMQATDSIPIVMAAGSDPVAAGFAASIARPGRNVTGITFFSDDLVGKQLALLKEMRPRTSRVLVVVPVSPS